MTWDNTVPLASESLKLGDDRIRETKEDFQNAVDDEKIFPGPDPLNAPVCYDKIQYGTTAARPAANASNTGRFYVNTTTKTIQYDNGGAWADITPPYDLFPSGAVLAFFQSAAPTGWTQITDSAINDTSLRIVSSTGGTTGGTDSISSPPTHGHGGGSTGSQTIPHTHTNSANIAAWITNSSGVSIPLYSSAIVTATGAASDTAHVHSIADDTGFTPAYANFILAARN